jgi:lysophospholipase L1-like esterase
MDQVMCFSPSWGTITAVKLVYAAFDMPQQGEVDRPIAAALSNASVFVPSAPVEKILTSTAFSAGASSIQCSPTTVSGCNSVSAGQYVSGPIGSTYFAAGTYVTSVVNSFAVGTGNTPTGTSINLSAPTTAGSSGGLLVTYAGQIAPVRWGGRIGVTISPAHDVVTSDPLSLSMAPNTQFFVRTAATMSGPGLQLADMPGGYRFIGANNEFDARSASLNDHTLDPTNISNTGGGFWGPVAVLALVTPPVGEAAPGAVLILGDSIATGTGDNPDPLLYTQGYIQRSLQNFVPFVTAARGSTDTGEEAAQGSGQFSLATDTGITDVLLELGRNDIWEKHVTSTVLEGFIQTVTARYNAAGKRVWCFTVPPTTQSTDGWTTLANQSWGGSQVKSTDEVSRETYNSDLRTPAKLAGFGCYGLIDVTKYFDDPGGSGKWRVDLGSASVDGVHPSAVLHQAVVNSSILSPSIFGVP